MRDFIFQNFDSFIALIGGVFFCHFAFKPLPEPGDLRRPFFSPSFAKTARVLGPLMILSALGSMAIQHFTFPDWERQFSPDKVASVEFPSEPSTTHKVDTIQGQKVRVDMLRYRISWKDITLVLAFAPILRGEEHVNDAARIEHLQTLYVQRGFTPIRVTPVQCGVAPGHLLELERDNDQVRMWQKVVHYQGMAYSAMAGAPAARQDDPLISHFLDSFRVEPVQ